MNEKRRMNQKIKGYLVIVGHILAGLIILLSVQQVKLPVWLHSSAVLFLAFLFLNLVSLRIFRLQKEAKEFWTPRKIIFLIWGALGGIVLAVLPVLFDLFAGQLQFSDITFHAGISVLSVVITFVIILWEELWFRGLFLNYCRRSLSSIHLSVVIGLLFMAIHVFNPEIDLLQKGPALFFAGAVLTLLYFYYKTIWLPVGIHFGNNLPGAILDVSGDTNLFFGNEGYLQALILAGVFFFFIRKIKKRSASVT